MVVYYDYFVAVHSQLVKFGVALYPVESYMFAYPGGMYFWSAFYQLSFRYYLSVFSSLYYCFVLCTVEQYQPPSVIVCGGWGDYLSRRV